MASTRGIGSKLRWHTTEHRLSSPYCSKRAIQKSLFVNKKHPPPSPQTNKQKPSENTGEEIEETNQNTDSPNIPPDQGGVVVRRGDGEGSGRGIPDIPGLHTEENKNKKQRNKNKSGTDTEQNFDLHCRRHQKQQFELYAQAIFR